MQNRRGRIQRGHHVSDNRERIIVHLNQRSTIFGCGTGGCNHSNHRFTNPTGSVHGHRMLGWGFQPLEVFQHSNPRRANLGQIGTGEYPQDAFDRFGVLCINAKDFGMRKWRPYKDHMHHAWQGDVVHISAPTLDQSPGIGARDSLAYVGIRTVGIAKLNGHVCTCPARCRATASTASTMASYPVQRQ